MFTYSLCGVQLPLNTCVRDLGVLISHDLKFSLHCSSVVAKTYQLLGLIFRSLPPDPDLLLRAFKVYVRPILEYASVVWSPNSAKDILLLEKVQKYFTRRALNYPNLKYAERLIVLGLDFLETRRVHCDLAFCYRVLNGFVNVDTHDFLKRNLYRNSARISNSKKLVIPRAHLDVRQDYFAVRVVNIWNDLPDSVVNLRSAKSFKKALLRVNLTEYMTRFD